MKPEDIKRPNLQILANAGSGKTHTLVTRIIRLLMMGVPPRRIIALTVTRKAAGEFLGKLLQRILVHPAFRFLRLNSAMA